MTNSLHSTIAAVRWTMNEIDWREVVTIVIHGLVTTAFLIWFSVTWTRRQVLTLSERIGCIYSSVLVKQSATTKVNPMVHPLAEIAAELDTLTCKELRKIVGVKRNVRKAHLIAYAIA
jgi:hypothetical protein